MKVVNIIADSKSNGIPNMESFPSEELPTYFGRPQGQWSFYYLDLIYYLSLQEKAHIMETIFQ